MQESMLMSGLANYLINAVTQEGGWDLEPGINKETNPLNTSEVLCGLISARARLCLSGLPNNYDKIISNGIMYLQATQLDSGGWATGSAYRLPETRESAKGNAVSTCFALWAQILSYELVEKNHELVNVVRKAITFFTNCCDDDGFCFYSPGLTARSPIATAYILLSYSLILAWDSSFGLLTKEERLEVSQGVSIILESTTGSDALASIKSNYISAILMYSAILSLPDTREIAANLRRRVRSNLATLVSGLALEQCTVGFTESQVIREDGKTARDFMHYVPVWMLVLYSQVEKSERCFCFQVLNSVMNNVHPQFEGVYLSGKRWTWVTGLTLFALTRYFSNLDVDALIQKEGIQMVDGSKVFIVHGRDFEFKGRVLALLRALSLQPLEWEQVVQATGKATPTTYEVINKGFEIAQSIIVLLSGC